MKCLIKKIGLYFIPIKTFIDPLATNIKCPRATRGIEVSGTEGPSLFGLCVRIQPFFMLLPQHLLLDYTELSMVLKK